MIVEKFQRAHPPISHPDREQIPVLAVQMPPESAVIHFCAAQLAALGAPIRPHLANQAHRSLAHNRVIMATGGCDYPHPAAGLDENLGDGQDAITVAGDELRGQGIRRNRGSAPAHR